MPRQLKRPGTSSRSCVAAPDPQQCIVLLAHGASGWNARLDSFAKLLDDAAPSVSVVPLVYPYAAGSQRRPPPKAESLLEYHLEKVKEIASLHPNASIVLAGHSMGGRVSVMVAALPSLPSQVRGVICFSYPLVGINRSLRLEPLKACCIPVFMLQGSRDSFFPSSAAAQVPSPVTVFAIDGGDHSLCLTKSKLRASFSSSQDVCDRASILPALTAAFQELHLRGASKRPRPCARLWDALGAMESAR